MNVIIIYHKPELWSATWPKLQLGSIHYKCITHTNVHIQGNLMSIWVTHSRKIKSSPNFFLNRGGAVARTQFYQGFEGSQQMRYRQCMLVVSQYTPFDPHPLPLQILAYGKVKKHCVVLISLCLGLQPKPNFSQENSTNTLAFLFNPTPGNLT